MGKEKDKNRKAQQWLREKFSFSFSNMAIKEIEKSFYLPPFFLFHLYLGVAGEQQFLKLNLVHFCLLNKKKQKLICILS